MELKWLEDFITLASTRSFTKSAQMRHVTQSAFSRRIRQLEIWLGVTLVNRAAMPAELTKEGRDFLPAAYEMVQNFYRTRMALQPQGGSDHDVVCFSALHTLTVTFFPQWLKAMQQQAGPLRSRLCPDRGGIEANAETLADGEVDFFLTYAHASVPFLLDETRYHWKRLGEEQLLPIVAAEFSDHYIEHVIESGEDLPFLSYGKTSFFGAALEKIFATQPKFKRRTIHENTMSVGLKAMAMAGWGVAWLPASLVQNELVSGQLKMASHDAQWVLTPEIRIYRDTAPLSMQAETLWQAISEIKLS